MCDPRRVGWGWELSVEGGLYVILFKEPPKKWKNKNIYYKKSGMYSVDWKNLI